VRVVAKHAKDSLFFEGRPKRFRWCAARRRTFRGERKSYAEEKAVFFLSGIPGSTVSAKCPLVEVVLELQLRFEFLTLRFMLRFELVIFWPNVGKLRKGVVCPRGSHSSSGSAGLYRWSVFARISNIFDVALVPMPRVCPVDHRIGRRGKSNTVVHLL